MKNSETPMRQQYTTIRKGLSPDILLFFRAGDFFELYDNDAVIASQVLGITLTQRSEIPMAGVPQVSLDTYVGKLLACGKKVAICDQVGPVQTGKLVQRAITRIYSSGTALQDAQLQPNQHRYLAALHNTEQGVLATWIEVSTGEFFFALPHASLLPMLSALNPAEILVMEDSVVQLPDEWQEFIKGRTLSTLPPSRFTSESGTQELKALFSVHNLNGFGIPHAVLGCAGAIIYYITDSLRTKPTHIVKLVEYPTEQLLQMDPATLRNLEILQPLQFKNFNREGSLYFAMNKTVTAAGARLLESWLATPTLVTDTVLRRQSWVTAFLTQDTPRIALHQLLANTRDLVRIMSRLQNRVRSPRDLGAIRDTLVQIPQLQKFLQDTLRSVVLHANEPQIHNELVQTIASLQNFCPELTTKLSQMLVEELPAVLELDGATLFRSGVDAELDRLKGLNANHQTWLSDYEQSQQTQTGIKSLKVKYTSTFGYFIEVTKANLSNVPSSYRRRQTTVNGERYVTEELRQREDEILHAGEHVFTQEQALFSQLVELTITYAPQLRQVAQLLAELDIFLGWATLATNFNYCRPQLVNNQVTQIVAGRHPVVEQQLPAFCPNDTFLQSDEAQIMLLTGPNMAGKSTYIRQIALITLMAQIGSYVPAQSCIIGIVDRIFARVGAQDDISRGNSTFMVEMNETSYILRHATAQSLVILDEVGRGTSTYDGLAIAWSILEHLQKDSNGPRTLFATHYHELTQLVQRYPRIRNFHVSVQEAHQQIVFLHKIQPGPASRSYGVHVAQLAGLPASIVNRATQLLNSLESGMAPKDIV